MAGQPTNPDSKRLRSFADGLSAMVSTIGSILSAPPLQCFRKTIGPTARWNPPCTDAHSTKNEVQS
ncbi:MAG: hypothetical protein QM761_01730 [Pseudoxanthomonas sp.]